MSEIDLDPLDTFVLDALLADDPLSPMSPPTTGLSGQAALGALLVELDAFNRDVSDVAACNARFDLTAAAHTAAISNGTSSTALDGDSVAVASTDERRRSKTAHASSIDPLIPSFLTESADESSRRAGATTKEAFSVLAQQVALVFALEPERPLKRAWRVRAKEKINTLRDTIESLECHLAALKSNRQQARESAMTTIAMLTDSGKGGAEALETNRKLRKLVNTQLQFAGKVGEKLLAHTNTELQLTLTTERFEKQAPLTDADFAVFYEALTGKLDAIYSQWDKVLVERNLASAEVSFQDAHVEISEDNIATLYFRDEKLLPFDFQSVNDACWRHAKMGSITAEDQGGIVNLLPRDDDVVLVKKAFSLPLANNEHAAIPIRSVFKRFVSETRVVLCWEGTAEWPGELVSDSEATRSPMRENGWGLIRPMPGNPELCHVQVCVRMKPGLSDERILDIPAQVGQLTRMMIPAYQRMISTRFQMVENLLIDKFFGGGDNGF